MATKIQLRRDSAANWASVNPTLAEGELGIELDTGTFKFGDGSTAWNDLPYIGGSSGLNWVDNSDNIIVGTLPSGFGSLDDPSIAEFVTAGGSPDDSGNGAVVFGRMNIQIGSDTGIDDGGRYLATYTPNPGSIGSFSDFLGMGYTLQASSGDRYAVAMITDPFNFGYAHFLVMNEADASPFGDDPPGLLRPDWPFTFAEGDTLWSGTFTYSQALD